MIGRPVGRAGEAVNEKVQRGGTERDKVDHQRLALIDIVVRRQHLFDLRHNLLHCACVVVADANGLVDASVQHARRILERDRGEHRVRHIEGSLVKGADAGYAPADVLDGALDLPVGGSNPITNRERAVQKNTQAAQKVGQQIPCRKTDCNATHAAKCEQARHGNAEGLQDHDAGDDPKNDATQSRHRTNGRAIARFQRATMLPQQLLLNTPTEPMGQPTKQHQQCGIR